MSKTLQGWCFISKHSLEEGNGSALCPDYEREECDKENACLYTGTKNKAYYKDCRRIVGERTGFGFVITREGEEETEICPACDNIVPVSADKCPHKGCGVEYVTEDDSEVPLLPPPIQNQIQVPSQEEQERIIADFNERYGRHVMTDNTQHRCVTKSVAKKKKKFKNKFGRRVI